MSQMNIPPLMTRTATWVQPQKITEGAAFSFRRYGLTKDHVRSLAQALRGSGGVLDPLLLWQEIDNDGSPSGRLILLDGHHRLAAYNSVPADAQRTDRGVPAHVLACSRAAARREALRVNSKDTLPLSFQERQDGAWSLVRDGERQHTIPQIAKASGVGERTIWTMRQRLRDMAKAETAITGEWWRDRSDNGTGKEPEKMMTDAERKAEIERIGKEFRKVAGNLQRRDETLLAEALQNAFGHNLKSMAEWLYAESDEFYQANIAARGEAAEEDPRRDF
jgi:hypothetical protein